MGSVLLHITYGFVGILLFFLVPILIGVPINWIFGLCDRAHREAMERSDRGTYGFLCFLYGFVAIVAVASMYFLGMAIEFVYCRGF